MISIRAPLAGSDSFSDKARSKGAISIRAPLAGSDAPVPRAKPTGIGDFNPRSPCGERLENIVAINPDINFNPRSPCGERPAPGGYYSSASVFQSALPLRGATLVLGHLEDGADISIRAPLAGSDRASAASCRAAPHFNPRSPCGERLRFRLRALGIVIFQSALPLRGATTVFAEFGDGINAFQSALPLRGATFDTARIPVIIPNFNPRSPCGERPSSPSFAGDTGYFNPRSPCGERRHGERDGAAVGAISIRAPLAGSDRYIL